MAGRMGEYMLPAEVVEAGRLLGRRRRKKKKKRGKTEICSARHVQMIETFSLSRGILLTLHFPFCEAGGGVERHVAAQPSL